MSAQHSPAPWSWVGNSLEDRHGQTVLKAVDSHEPWGLHTAELEEHDNPEEAAANRLLIAAAPELQEALKLLHDNARFHKVDPFALSFAAAALAKAKGLTA